MRDKTRQKPLAIAPAKSVSRADKMKHGAAYFCVSRVLLLCPTLQEIGLLYHSRTLTGLATVEMCSRAKEVREKKETEGMQYPRPHPSHMQ